MLTNFPENNGLDLAKIADEVQKKWEKENTFEISISSRPKENPFVFFDLIRKIGVNKNVMIVKKGTKSVTTSFISV